MRTGRAVVWLPAFATIALAPTQAQTPQATFHSQIDYVEFPVRVVDGNGHFVGDLPQAAFQILEDGKPQTIERFSFVDDANPSNTPRPSSELMQVVTDPAELGQTPGRIYLFVFDDYHMRPEDVPRAKEVVGHFISTRVNDDDRVAMVMMSGGGENFTGSREALLSMLDRWHGRALGPANPAERQMQARVTLTSLTQTSEWLNAARGRRKVLFLIGDEIGCAFGPSCGTWLSDAVKSAQFADVSIYPLLTRDADIADCRTAQYAGGLPEGCGGSSHRARPASALSVLATETGGFLIDDMKRVDAAFDRVLQENGSYYLVGYYSTNNRHDGKGRKNDVRIANEGLHALYRPGYRAPRDNEAKN